MSPGWRGLGTVMLSFVLVLCWLQTATAQPLSQTQPTPQPGSIEQEKTRLEVQKLQSEIAKLQKDDSEWATWIPILLGFLGAVIGTVSSFLLARWARHGAIDQATHEKRLDSYAKLIKATSRLALYFPHRGKECVESLDPGECRVMGQEMSQGYFDGGGLLLSTEARDAYFKLARALTCASFASELRVPKFPDDAPEISQGRIDDYVRDLKEELALALNDVEKWKFLEPESKPGDQARGQTDPHERFKDYIFLQRLSSQLRTALAADLHSRRRVS